MGPATDCKLLATIAFANSIGLLHDRIMSKERLSRVVSASIDTSSQDTGFWLISFFPR